jgi:glucokinase
MTDEATDLIAIDLGGTHARFASASVAGGRVVTLQEAETYAAKDFTSLESAWRHFIDEHGHGNCRNAAIAVASPITADLIKLTNNPWTIRPAELADRMNLEKLTLINDFGAVAHATAQLDIAQFMPLAGPTHEALPHGLISICGPGTGLGVAAVLRDEGGYRVLETEGGHIDFAPLDEIDDRILHHLRARHLRVSAERVVSGPGIVAIYEVLSAIEGRSVRQPLVDRDIWAAALQESDPLAVAALERFCMALGAFAGDIALAHGASGVVIGGGLGLRLGSKLQRPGFAERFVAKGRFSQRLAQIPVWLIVHPQAGLYGAAAAFAQEHVAG